MSRPSRVDPARLVAFEVLKAVRVDDAYTNLALPAQLRRHGLSGRDAAFATELASGTIRWRGTYDAILAACVDRPLAKVESKVLDALRLGCHQLLSMRVPAHAAISTTVDLVRDRVGAVAAGFANAVLRKVTGLPIEGYVVLGFPGFTRIVDEQGGIPLVIPKTVVASHARNMVIKAGPQTLTGKHLAD